MRSTLMSAHGMMVPTGMKPTQQQTTAMPAPNAPASLLSSPAATTNAGSMRQAARARGDGGGNHAGVEEPITVDEGAAVGVERRKGDVADERGHPEVDELRRDVV